MNVPSERLALKARKSVRLRVRRAGIDASTSAPKLPLRFLSRFQRCPFLYGHTLGLEDSAQANISSALRAFPR
jgi:hypothetical protein